MDFNLDVVIVEVYSCVSRTVSLINDLLILIYVLILGVYPVLILCAILCAAC